jgi:hypothetical protein
VGSNGCDNAANLAPVGQKTAGKAENGPVTVSELKIASN